MVIWNLHEGDGAHVSVREGNLFIGNSNASVREDILNWNGVDFIKTEIKDEQLLLESLLFSGEYLINDKPVVFSPNGKLSGIENYTYYTAIADYMGAGMELNMIELKEPEKLPVRHTFEFKEDSLIISEILCQQYDSINSLCYDLKKGKELFKLKRIN